MAPKKNKPFTVKHLVARDGSWVTVSTIRNWIIVLREDGSLRHGSRTTRYFPYIIRRYNLLGTKAVRRRLSSIQWSVVKHEEIPVYDDYTDDEEVQFWRDDFGAAHHHRAIRHGDSPDRSERVSPQLRRSRNSTAVEDSGSETSESRDDNANESTDETEENVESGETSEESIIEHRRHAPRRLRFSEDAQTQGTATLTLILNIVLIYKIINSTTIANIGCQYRSTKFIISSSTSSTNFVVSCSCGY